MRLSLNRAVILVALVAVPLRADITVTGYKLRISATAQQFGYVEMGGQGTGAWVIGHASVKFFGGTTQSMPVMFDDEYIYVTGTYRPDSTLRLLKRVKAVVEVQSGSQGSWRILVPLQRTREGDHVNLTGRFRIQPGVTAFRVSVTESRMVRVLGREHHSGSYQVRVRRAPRVLTFVAMGGSGLGGSGSSGPSGGSSGSSSGSDAASSGGTSGDGIVSNLTQCDVEERLLPILMEPDNVQCNDLCAPCRNFVEHIGLRILEEENLGNEFQCLRHKESPTEADFCSEQQNPFGLSNRIIVGKWDNSEHEAFRPSANKTFESILDEYQSSGGGSLIIIANSLAGAKLAATVKDHWRWGDSITVRLFAAWDATHLGGGIDSVGARPETVVNFFQTDNWLYFQNGHSIAEADEEHDLTKCLSHNAIARSMFVHDRTYQRVRMALADLRREAREG